MAKRICFSGKSGIGKSVIPPTQRGFGPGWDMVLQIGNDCGMNSTFLLMKGQEMPAMMEEYREKYTVSAKEYIAESPCGVYCLELGGIAAGCGCQARSVSIADEILREQRIEEQLGLDFILYDISGDIPCTGYSLPVRDGTMQESIIVTSGAYSSISTANSILTAILKIRKSQEFPIRLLGSGAEDGRTEERLTEYSRQTGVRFWIFFIAMGRFPACRERAHCLGSGATFAGGCADSGNRRAAVTRSSGQSFASHGPQGALSLVTPLGRRRVGE
ncbi:MAG: hypothetical protein ACLTXL_01710 [Clostridia bacterium]